MRSPNSSHVVGAVSGVHGIFGLLPSAGRLSVILVSSLFWSLASCTMFGRSKGPCSFPGVGTAPWMDGGVAVLEWCKDRTRETSGDAVVACLLSKPHLNVVVQELSFQFEERRAMSKRSFDVSLVGGAFPGWFVRVRCSSYSPLDGASLVFSLFLSVVVVQ